LKQDKNFNESEDEYYLKQEKKLNKIQGKLLKEEKPVRKQVAEYEEN